MDHMMGLDIIRWLDVVGMSHMVSSVMTKMNRSSMDSMMDRSMDWSMYCMMYWSMYCMMYRCMNCVMNSCMMNRSRDGMDSVNRRGRDGLIVHGGSSIERGVNWGQVRQVKRGHHSGSTRVIYFQQFNIYTDMRDPETTICSARPRHQTDFLALKNQQMRSHEKIVLQ